MRKYDPRLPIWARGLSFDLFGEKKDCLVLKVLSPQLIGLYNDLQKYEQTTYFPDYKPHITLSYQWKGACPILTENILICYNSHVCCALED